VFQLRQKLRHFFYDKSFPENKLITTDVYSLKSSDHGAKNLARILISIGTTTSQNIIHFEGVVTCQFNMELLKKM
jgi:hypothetical protein